MQMEPGQALLSFQALPEKFLPGRVLRKVLLQPLAEPRPLQTSKFVMEAINMA
jgi:hypothetical protein